MVVQHELQELKARTMHNMVETIHTEVGQKKMLFLHNNQARVFDGDNVVRLLAAFELPEPRLVIQLVPTEFGLAHEDHVKHIEQLSGHKVPSYCSSIHNVEAAAKTELELTLFMRDCLIPMAVDARAYIVVSMSPTCSLTSALSKALRMVRSRFGARPPFTIIGVDSAVKNYNLAVAKDRTTYTSQICKGSKRWKESLPQFAAYWDSAKALAKSSGETLYKCAGNTLGLSALPEMVDTMVLIDALDVSDSGPPMLNRLPVTQLRQTILSELSSSLPSIALRCCGSSKRKTADLLEIQVPVVYINMRENLLGAAGPSGQCGHTSSLDLMNQMSENKDRENPAKLGHTTQARVNEAIRLFDAHVSEVRAMPPRDGMRMVERWDTSTVAFFHRALYGSDPEVGGGDRHAEYLYEGISRLKGVAQTSSTMRPLALPDEQLHRVIDCIMRNEVQNYYVANGQEPPEGSYEETLRSLPSQVRQEMQEQWGWFYSTLSSKFLYSAHVSDKDTLAQLLRRLIKLDNLPAENPIGGMELLVEAWNIVEMASLIGHRYKRGAKVLILLTLLIGIAVVAVVVLKAEIDTGENIGGTSMSESDAISFVLTLALTVLSACSAIFSPNERWKHLCSIAFQLESEIWRYRTRVGDYSNTNHRLNAHSISPETALRETIIEMRQNLTEGGGILHTSFNSEAHKSAYSKGQYAPPDTQKDLTSSSRIRPAQDGVCQLQDDHQSPLRPAEYIPIRLLKMQAFYQQRLPSYDFSNTALRSGIVLATAGATVVAFFGHSSYVAIITATTAAFANFLEFHAPVTKLSRYNRAITTLESTVSWWQSLTPIEKAMQSNVVQLIETVEETVVGELRSWSISGAKKKHDEDSEDEANETHRSKTKGKKDPS
eukprot:TRINITY_DN7075_c0_g1_i2.p1 TRINITY_DN7075_c0_g1~~TRINITY_DN7075_c0_g1_i2.p1  ORF type:complete len:886 (+),score=158.92 TRINITY_DN7075_c0_g1_i2:107-2764(+)